MRVPPSLASWLRGVLWLLLGGWLGAWTFFAFAVAPTAFRVLPSTEIAGQLVGPLLAALHLYGAAAGIALAGLARALGRSGACLWIPLAMSGSCLVSEFGVTPAIAETRALAFGASGSPEMAARFQLLHQISMAIYTAVGVAGLALVAIHARADAAARGR
jgi:hypothetical protein